MNILQRVLRRETVAHLGLEERAVTKAMAKLIMEHGTALHILTDLQIKEGCDAAIKELAEGRSTQWLVDELAKMVRDRIKKGGVK